MVADGGVALVGLLGRVADGVVHLLDGFIAVLAVEGEVVGLAPAEPGLIVPAVGGKVLAVLGGLAVAELDLQGLAVGVENIGVKMQGVAGELVIGDLAAAQVRDDPGGGVVGGAGGGIGAAGGVVPGAVVLGRGVRVRVLAGVLGRGVRLLGGVRLVGLIRGIRLFRLLGLIGGVRLLGGVRFFRLIRRRLGRLGLSLRAQGVRLGLGQGRGAAGGQAQPRQGRRQHQGRRQKHQQSPQKIDFAIFHTVSSRINKKWCYSAIAE